MPLIKIHNVETGEEIEREMNAEELAQYEEDLALSKKQKALEAQNHSKREALLEKLGITEDEARLLLG